MIGIEDFVAVHDCDEVLGVGEVDDVVGVTGKHNNRLYFVAAYLKVENFICAFFSHLDKSAAFHNDELFPLGVVPVLAFGDAGLGNVDADLATIGSVDQFSERAAVVAVHFEIEYSLVFRQIAEIGREKTFGEAVGRNLRYHQCLW